jgi:hypothetical protein
VAGTDTAGHLAFPVRKARQDRLALLVIRGRQAEEVPLLVHRGCPARQAQLDSKDQKARQVMPVKKVHPATMDRCVDSVATDVVPVLPMSTAILRSSQCAHGAPSIVQRRLSEEQLDETEDEQHRYRLPSTLAQTRERPVHGRIEIKCSNGDKYACDEFDVLRR